MKQSSNELNGNYNFNHERNILYVGNRSLARTLDPIFKIFGSIIFPKLEFVTICL